MFKYFFVFRTHLEIYDDVDGARERLEHVANGVRGIQDVLQVRVGVLKLRVNRRREEYHHKGRGADDVEDTNEDDHVNESGVLVGQD